MKPKQNKEQYPFTGEGTDHPLAGLHTAITSVECANSDETEAAEIARIGLQQFYDRWQRKLLLDQGKVDFEHAHELIWNSSSPAEGIIGERRVQFGGKFRPGVVLADPRQIAALSFARSSYQKEWPQKVSAAESFSQKIKAELAASGGEVVNSPSAVYEPLKARTTAINTKLSGIELCESVNEEGVNQLMAVFVDEHVFRNAITK